MRANGTDLQENKPVLQRKQINRSTPDYLFDDPISSYLVDSSTSGAYELLSPGYQIEKFSKNNFFPEGFFNTADVSYELAYEIRMLLTKHGINNSSKWFIKQMNDTARAKTYVPYVLVTTTGIFIDEFDFKKLKQEKPKQYELVCLYIIEQIKSYSYIQTQIAQCLSGNATLAMISYVIVPKLTNMLATGFSYTALDSTLDAMISYMPTPVRYVVKFLIGQLVYYKVEAYVGPVVNAPFSKYIEYSLLTLDQNVLKAAGDLKHKELVMANLLREFGKTMDANDPRRKLVIKRLMKFF